MGALSQVPLGHSAQFKVGLGSQSLMCNTLFHPLHSHFVVFFFWPLIMISRTWERSIILVSISMMSGCSLAPLMNSSNVNSPDDTSRRTEQNQNQPETTNSASEELSGAAEHWRTRSQTGLLTFSIDVDLVVYQSNNLLRGNIIRSGDILNSLTQEMQYLF